jgi:hypothetical protein
MRLATTKSNGVVIGYALDFSTIQTFRRSHC